MHDGRFTENDGHLDLLRIDAVRAGEGTEAESAHVAACPECRATLALFREAAERLAAPAGPEAEVPPEVERAILEEYRRAFGRPSRLRWRVRARWFAPAVGTAAAAGVALFLWLSGERGAVRAPGARPGTESARVASLPPAPPAGPSPAAAPASPGAAAGAAKGSAAPSPSAAPAAEAPPGAPVDVLAAYRMALEAERRAGGRLAWNRGPDASEAERAVDEVARRAVAL